MHSEVAEGMTHDIYHYFENIGLVVMENINIEQTLDYMKNHAEPYAKAKATRIYLEQFRKSQKALLELEAEGTIQEKDAYAYTDPKYLTLLEDLRTAIEVEEREKWMLTAAQAKVDIYRTQQANNRFIDKAHT